MPIEAAVGEAGIAHDFLNGHPGKTIAVEKPPGAFKDFLTGVALVIRRIGHGFVLRDLTILPPKDDLEHLLPIELRGDRNVSSSRWRGLGVSMMNGPGRVVLITGASSGIGRATAELLAARGYRVFGGVRDAATTRPLAGVELVPLDVRNEPSVKACVDEVHNRAGRIDVLINNAGVNLVGAVEETSISQAQALFDTNVFGVLRMIQAVLPGMRRQGSGLIVNLSSILGFVPGPFMGVYTSTKHAIEGLSESLDHEVRTFGIRVVLIEPHYTRTHLDASAAQAEGRIDAYAPQRQKTAAVITRNTNTAPEPELVAEEVLRAIEGPYRMRRPVGQAVLLSWLRRLLPVRLFEPSLRKAFALDPSNKGAAVTQARIQP